MSLLSSALAVCLLIAAGGETVRASEHTSASWNPHWILSPGRSSRNDDASLEAALREHTFTLRHIYHHGAQRYPNLHRYIDIRPDNNVSIMTRDEQGLEPAPKTLTAQAQLTSIERLVNRRPEDIDKLLRHADVHGEALSLPPSAWTVDEVAGPNITDRETVLSFARMAQDAYVQEHNAHDWLPVGSGYNYTDDFGWESDGLRGHIFADETNATIVIGLKGTSPALFDGADTTGNDKLNDNLFGSCCCGQGGQYLWKQVCDCMTSAYNCNQTCLVRSLRQKSHYYWAARDLYQNVTERYPDSEVWLSGHSLGGVVSSMLSLTYGLPAVTFEAFPDALAASRLGLPVPPGYRIGSHQSRDNIPIHHFGHTADPIFMGTCNAASSFCTLAGYAFQGVCHTGHTCTYDTVGDLGWRVGVGTHKISNVIKDVLEKYDTVPGCETDVDCQDCFNWKFFESNGSEPTTSSSSSTSSTRTRTTTCKTPGWWGCLDESATTTKDIPPTTTTAESSTSTCKTPGWFGCKDSTSTTTTTSSVAALEPSAAPAPTITTTHVLPTLTSPSASCTTPGWFQCRDSSFRSPQNSAAASRTTPPPATSIPVTSTRPNAGRLPTARRKKCRSRHWYGICREWRYESDEFEGDL